VQDAYGIFRYIREMEKVITKAKLKDRKNDLVYWMTQTPAERVAALESLRSDYMKGIPDAERGFQYVCTIVRRKQR
jgi:hypothetical protein